MFLLLGIKKYEISVRMAIFVTIDLEGPQYNIKPIPLLMFQ
jgi:hypothetical protein